MALINKLRAGEFAQKKMECFAALPIVEKAAAETGATEAAIEAGTTDDFLVLNLPPDAIATNAYVFVKNPSDAATSAIATLGTTEGGSEIMSAGDLTTAGKQGTFTGEVDTGTGLPIYLGITYTGAATNVGDYVFVIEYLEYDKNTGEYTRINNVI